MLKQLPYLCCHYCNGWVTNGVCWWVTHSYSNHPQ